MDEEDNKPMVRKNGLHREFFNFRTVFMVALVLLLFLFSAYLNDENRDAFGFLHSKDTWSTLAKELAFALVVALVIVVGIESSSRSELKELIEKDLERTKKNVFSSVFQRGIPPDIVQYSMDQLEKIKFVRSELRATYRLGVECARSLDEADTSLPDVDIVVLNVETEYSIKNVTNENQDLEVVAYVERPPFGVLKRFTDIQKLVIDKRVYTNNEVIVADASWDDTDEFKRCKILLKDIAPGGIRHVRTEFRTIKLKSDTEVWRALYPSDSMTLQVIFDDPPKVWGCSGIHTGVPRESGRDKTFIRKIVEPVMPHQGMIFWWSFSDSP